MKRLTHKLSAVLILLLLGWAPLAAQQSGDIPPLRKEIVKVNYIEAREAYQILHPYKSRYGHLQMLQPRNTLIIEDQPSFVEKLLSILMEIDTKPLDLQFFVDIIQATTEKTESDRRLDSDPVIKELKKLVKLESFKLLDTALIKVQDNSHTTQRLGGDGISLQLSLAPRHLQQGGQEAFQVELSLRHYYGFKQDRTPATTTLINTTLSVKSGERSVVGVSKLNGGDKSLILILQGKVLK